MTDTTQVPGLQIPGKKISTLRLDGRRISRLAPTPPAKVLTAAPKATEPDYSKSAAYASGARAAHSRGMKVLASKEFAGRRAQALTLMGNVKLSADEIIKLLAELPKHEGDAAGAQAMMDSIISENLRLSGEAGDAHSTAPTSAGWKSAHVKAKGRFPDMGERANHGWGRAIAMAKNMYGLPEKRA